MEGRRGDKRGRCFTKLLGQRNNNCSRVVERDRRIGRHLTLRGKSWCERTGRHQRGKCCDRLWWYYPLLRKKRCVLNCIFLTAPNPEDHFSSKELGFYTVLPMTIETGSFWSSCVFSVALRGILMSTSSVIALELEVFGIYQIKVSKSEAVFVKSQEDRFRADKMKTVVQLIEKEQRLRFQLWDC